MNKDCCSLQLMHIINFIVLTGVHFRFTIRTVIIPGLQQLLEHYCSIFTNQQLHDTYLSKQMPAIPPKKNVVGHSKPRNLAICVRSYRTKRFYCTSLRFNNLRCRELTVYCTNYYQTIDVFDRTSKLDHTLRSNSTSYYFSYAFANEVDPLSS